MMPYSAKAYAAHFRPGFRDADIPAAWWRKIELRYLDRQVITLVYASEPSSAREIPDLMWELQCRAAEYGYRITVVDAAGNRTSVPAVGAREPRVRGRQAGEP